MLSCRTDATSHTSSRRARTLSRTSRPCASCGGLCLKSWSHRGGQQSPTARAHLLRWTLPKELVLQGELLRPLGQIFGHLLDHNIKSSRTWRGRCALQGWPRVPPSAASRCGVPGHMTRWAPLGYRYRHVQYRYFICCPSRAFTPFSIRLPITY